MKHGDLFADTATQMGLHAQAGVAELKLLDYLKKKSATSESPRASRRGRIEARNRASYKTIVRPGLHAQAGVAELKRAARRFFRLFHSGLHAQAGVAELKPATLRTIGLGRSCLHAQAGVAELKLYILRVARVEIFASPRASRRGRIEAVLFGVLVDQLDIGLHAQAGVAELKRLLSKPTLASSE